ncbi:hypothetical protein ACJX0J_031403 [Zea mays]
MDNDMTLKKSQLFYASLSKYFLLHFLIAIWLDSIYSEGIGLHTKKIYMTRWFGIVCLCIHNFASFNEGNQDIEKTIEKQFATCVKKIEGHRIKMLNFMTYGVSEYYIIINVFQLPQETAKTKIDNNRMNMSKSLRLINCFG